MRKSLSSRTLAILAIALAASCIAAQAQTVNGKVVDSHARPIAGAKVYVFDFSVRQLEPTPQAVLTTDKRGSFSYRLKRPENAPFGQAFGVVAPGYGVGAAYSSAGEPVTVVMRPPVTVRGKAVDENGKPLSGARIKIVAYFADPKSGGRQAILPGPIPGAMESLIAPDGAFDIKGLPDPAYYTSFGLSVRVTGAGVAGTRMDFKGADIAKGLKVVAPPACTIEGRLWLPDKAGPAPKGTKVRVVTIGRPDWYERDVPVDEHGTFRLTDVPPTRTLISLTPGPAVIRAGLPVLESTSQWVLPTVSDTPVSPSQPSRVELVLLRGALIRGTVTEKQSGAPIEEAVVTFTHLDDTESRIMLVAVTDSQGRFEMRVAPGRVKVALMKARGQFLPPDEKGLEFTLADGEEKSGVALQFSAVQ